ncbi:MAG: hypothetical protein AAF125_11015, partial [Chloroflexota bacterium]
IMIVVVYVPPIKKHLLPLAFWIALAVFGVVVSIMFVLRPSHMFTSLTNLANNMFGVGSLWWGGTLWFSLLASLLVRRVPRLPHARLIYHTVWLYGLVVLALSFARSPYRVGWGDTGNRVLFQIIPALIFYVMLRVAQFISHPHNTSSKDESGADA